MTTVSITKSAKKTNKVVQITRFKIEQPLVTRICYVLIARIEDIHAS
ncbi:hypothetical protein BC03BB108_C0114 (plasmid) [Bacillus cereus 03BB108]|nr:hypothetical protein BC03BB108_C0114 [Bacillus cereus 03BB108]